MRRVVSLDAVQIPTKRRFVEVLGIGPSGEYAPEESESTRLSCQPSRKVVLRNLMHPVEAKSVYDLTRAVHSGRTRGERAASPCQDPHLQ